MSWEGLNGGLHRRLGRKDGCRTEQRAMTNWGARLGDAAKQASNEKSPWKAPSKPTLPYLIIFGHAATPLYVGKPLLTPRQPDKPIGRPRRVTRKKPTPSFPFISTMVYWLGCIPTRSQRHFAPVFLPSRSRAYDVRLCSNVC